MNQRYVEYWSKKGEYGLERIRRADIRKKNRKDKKARRGTCPMCRRNQADVLAVCPYSEEIHGVAQMCKCCGNCRHDCAMDI